MLVLTMSAPASMNSRWMSRDHLRAREHQQVIAALEVALPVGEALAAIRGLVEPVLLDHGAHGAVEHHDALGKQLRAAL